MTDFSRSSEDRQQIAALLTQYDNLRKGLTPSYIEEDAFEQLIHYFESQEEYKKAMQAVEIATEQYPYSASLRIKKADLLLNSKAYEQALELLDQAAILDNANVNVYILKTEALLALDRQEEAAALLEVAISLFEGDEKLDLLFELADVYDDYENFDKVFDCLHMILEQDPTNEEALYKICFWTDFTGRNAEGIALHQKIIDDYPYNELAWFNLAAAYQGIRLYEKAIDAYLYAIAIDDKFDYAYRNMGDAYIRLRKYKEATEALTKVLELSKPEDVIYEAIGHCYEKMKNYAQARFYYRKASHLNPSDSMLFYKMAITYYREDKVAQSILQLETALKIKRNKPEYNLLMGECKMQLGLIKEAIQFFMNAVRVRPKSIATWEALIRCLYFAEYYDNGMEQVENAENMLGRKPIFRYYKAAFYFALGKVKQALAELEDGLAATPSLFKKLFELNPSLLQYQQVSDLLVRYKKKRNHK